MSELQQIQELVLTLPDDGELLDGLVRRFQERADRGMKFDLVLHHLKLAARTLAERMTLVCDAVESVAATEAKP